MTVKVIICNQNLSISQLNEILERFQSSKIVCSTHALFDNEIEGLSKLAKANCKFYNLADFFSDKELWEIDSFALNLLKITQPIPGKGGYEKFRYEMIKKRTTTLFEKLCNKFGEIELFVADGLGVQAGCLEIFNAKKVEPQPGKLDVQSTKKLISTIAGILKKITKTWGASRQWCEISIGNQNVILFSDKKRILNKLNASFKAIPFWKRFIMVITKKSVFPYRKNIMQACTFHEFYRLKKKMLIFQDGHWPSGYSYGHLWEYEPYYSFVPSNPFGEKWLKDSNTPFIKVKGFNDPYMTKLEWATSKKIVNILFALNHAGDWSSMINRSDTCKVIRAIKEIAQSNLDIKIRVRLHPGMTHFDHEGVDSYPRIVHEIESWNNSSVEISNDDLNEDLLWSDMVISEYSQVLIDSWNVGKLGISINLTKRRSFMKDYNELGFLNASSVNQLIKIITSDFEKLAERQNKAVEVFNQKMKDWS